MQQAKNYYQEHLWYLLSSQPSPLQPKQNQKKKV